MHAYRLNTALSAITQDQERRMRIVTLDTGTVVRTRATGPVLPQSGLVDVTVEGQMLSVFMQDLETRAERIEEKSA